MSEQDKYVPRLIENRLAEVHTCMPCKVIAFNEPAGTANVQPLYMIKYASNPIPQPRPPLMNVPVMKRRTKVSGVVTVDTPYYDVGDIVLVAFLERAYDMVKGGQVADPVYNRKHALEDGIIIGLL